jgi:recombinational DNA repair protein (RecF pathway)
LLREVGVRDTHPALRRELGWLEQAAYAAALIEQTTETDAPLPGHFQLLLGLVRQLPSAPPQSATVFAFEMKLLEESGLRPDLAAERLSPGVRQALAKLASADWAEAGRLRLSAGQTAEARQYLHGFLEQHLGRVPRQRAGALGAHSPLDEQSRFHSHSSP